MEKCTSGIMVFNTDSEGNQIISNIEELSTEARIAYLTSKEKDFIIGVVHRLCITIEDCNKIIETVNGINLELKALVKQYGNN